MIEGLNRGPRARRLLLMLVWLVGIVGLGACAAPPRPPSPAWAALAREPLPAPRTGAAPPPPGFLHERLDNGLRVSILPDPRSPVVATQLFYHVGSVHDDARRAGLAHLFEHLMFGDTRSGKDRDYDDFIHHHGGFANAYTAPDETVYVSLVAPAQHPRLLELEAARMGGLVLTEERLARERRIVSEEQRLRFENDPAARIGVRALRQVLGDHPYNRIGTEASIAAVTLDEARRFYARYYRPRNAHLVIVGPVDGPRTLAQVRGAFAAVPAGDEAPPADAPPLHQWPFPAEVAISQDLLPGKGAALLYPLPPPDHPDSWALLVIQQLLGGRRSPVVEELVRRRRVAVMAGAEVLLLRRGGGLLLFAGYLPYRSKAAALGYLEEARDRLGDLDWLTERSLEAAKRVLRKQLLQQQQRAEGQAQLLGQALHHHGDVSVAFDRAARIEAVTLAQARAAFARHVLTRTPLRLYATPERVPAWLRLFGWLYPLLWPAAPREAAAPPPPALPPLPAPAAGEAPRPAVSWAVDRATTALLLREPGSPLVELRVELPAGLWSPAFRRQHMEEAFTIQLHDAAGALRRRADELAASVHLAVGDDHSQLQLSCLRADLPAALALVRDLLRGRDFDRAELLRRRMTRGVTFTASQKNPHFRLRQEAVRRLHQPKDPRRRWVEEPDAVETAPRRLAAARDRLLRLPGRVIAVVGDLTEEQLAPLLGDLLPPADLQPVPADLQPAPALAPLDPVAGAYTVSMRPLNQSYLALVRPSLGLRHPDYPAFLLADLVLAGHFRSRLYQALRHDGGETYSPRSLELEDLAPGAYLLETYTRAENRARIEEKLRGALAQLHQGGLSEAERQDAVASLQGALARQGRTPGERLSRALFERRHGLPPRHREALVRRAAALSLAEINAFIRRFYDPARFALIAVTPK